MAGIGASCSFLPSRSKLRTTWLQFETHPGRKVSGKSICRRNLKIRADVNYVNAEEAKNLIAVERYAVLDVRDNSQYNRAHIKSSYHVPLFIENQDNDLGTIIKRTVHNNFSGLFFGLPFTKQNPEFVQSVKSQFSPESKLLVVCQEGLRSAAAANKLEEAGFQNIACITYIRFCRFHRAARCWKSWFGYSSRQDFSCTWNCAYLCISIHHFLPRASREVVPVVPCELVLKIPDFVDLNPCVTVGEIEFLKNCQHASQMSKGEQSL